MRAHFPMRTHAQVKCGPVDWIVSRDAWVFPHYGCKALFCAALCVVLLLNSLAARAQAISALRDGSADHILHGDEPLMLEIPAKGTTTVSLTLCAGCFAEIQIEQLHSMVSTVLTGPGVADPVPYGCDAGAHSIIHLPFIARDGGAYRLEIHGWQATAVSLKLTMNKPRPALPADTVFVAANETLQRGDKLWRSRSKGSAQQALATYDQAIMLAQEIGDTRLQQYALLGKARVFLYRTGEYQDGLKAVEEARALSELRKDAEPSAENTALDAFTWKTLSSAYSFLARYPEMLDATNHSLALYATLGDLYWQGVLEGNAADVYLETGDMQRALSSAEDALSIARQLSDGQGIAFTLAAVAAIHQERGEYQAAFDNDEAALEEMRQVPYPNEEGQVWMNLAALYDDLNDPERERDALNRSLPLLRQTKDAANESAALSNLAQLDLRQGKLQLATETLRQSTQIAQTQDLHRELALALLGQAEVFAAQGRLGQAAATIQSALDLSRKTGEAETTAMLLQEQGDVEARRGSTATALAAYRAAETAWSGVPNTEHTALAEASIARLELRSGQLDRAYNDVLTALDGFEASRSNVGSRSLRESFFASVHDFYDLAIESAMRRKAAAIALGHASEQYDTEAWAIAERARARSLMDAIRSSSSFSARNQPAELLDRSAKVERRIEETLRTILQLSAADNDVAALQQAKQRLHSLVLESEEVEAREREGSSVSLFGAGLHASSVSALRSALLGPDTALLEYWTGQRDTYLWIVTANNMQGLRLPAGAALNNAVRAYRQVLLAREELPPNEDLIARQARIARADHELDLQAKSLGNMLLPVRLPAAIHRLIVVPDGALASVPFAALKPTSDGASYLVRNYELVQEPSASVAIEILARPPNPRGLNRVAVFADPVYNQFDQRLTHRGDVANATPVASSPRDAVPMLRSGTNLDLNTLPRLKDSSREAKTISDMMGAGNVNLFVGFQANPQQVMQLPWRDYAVAHFATHAIVDSTHPELSGIVLSTINGEGTRQDGVLWLHTIYRTPMPVPLVILSGCSTASGKSIPGEGVTGLAQAFLSSGASDVIGTLWSIDDTASVQMASAFYRGLIKQRLSVAGTLRSAQLQMITTGHPPYDWAGYIVEGSPQANTNPFAH
jgi:CHAT domain-containing protein